MASMVSRECKLCGKTFLAEKYEVKRGRGIYCSQNCQLAALHKKTKVPESQWAESILKRFEKYKITDPVTGCWLWTKAKRGAPPYGLIRVKGFKNLVLVHRLSMHVYRGFDLSSGLFVCHHCDTPLCFNPDHLFVGTAQDNRNDAISKNRIDNSHFNKVQKWQYTQVIKYFKDNESIAAIARHFGVGWWCIRGIIDKELS